METRRFKQTNTYDNPNIEVSAQMCFEISWYVN